MTMITPSYLGETIEYSSLHACRSTLEDPTTLGPIGGADADGTAGRQAQSSSAIQTQSYEGMITDTHCGAKHSAALGMAAAECTRTCVHGGEQFALVDGDSVYVLEGHVEALKRTAGQRARIVGILIGNKISVSGVAAGE